MFIFRSQARMPKTKFTIEGSNQFVGLVKSTNGYGLIVVDPQQLNTVKDIAAIETSVASVFCGLRDYVAANVRQGFSHADIVARAQELGASAEFDDSEQAAT